jgi:hypothetical protein
MRIRKTVPRACAALRALVARGRERGSDLGMATAEYAICLIAATSFAGLLLAIMRSPEVRTVLMNLIKKALSG